MKIFETQGSNVSITPSIPTNHQPIATYLGRSIFLNRISVSGIDKGLWLHWQDPRDQGRPGTLKYGHCISPDQTLQDALKEVYQVIEANIDLEAMDEPVNPRANYC